MGTFSVSYCFRLKDMFSRKATKMGGTANRASAGVHKLGAAATKAAASVNRAAVAADRAAVAFNAAAAAAQRSAAGARTAGAGYDTAGRKALGAERRIKKLAWTMRAMRTVGRGFSGGHGSVGAGIGGGMGALGSAIIVKRFADYEDKLLDIRKVYTGNKSNLPALYAGLKNLHDKIALPRADIATLLEEGIRARVSPTLDTDELLAYTKVASQFMVAFKLPVDQASKKLAKLKSSLGLTLPELSALGDTMNTVANSMATNEHEMLEYVARLGGLAKSIGGMRGLQDVMAIGAAQMSAGTAKEVAATGMRTLLVRLGTQPAPTLKGLKALGLDPDEVKKRLPTDMYGTITDIITRISNLPKERQAEVLGQIAGLKTFNAFARLLGNIKLFDEARKVLEGKFRLRMIDEFNSRMTGLNAALQITGNVLADLGDSLVRYWRPTIAEWLVWMREMSANLEGNQWLAWTVGIYAAASALALLLLPLGMLAWSLMALGTFLTVVLTPLAVFARVLAGIGAAFLGGMYAAGRFVALVHRFAGAAAAAAVAFRMLRRMLMIGIAIEGITLAIQNLTMLRDLISEIGASWWTGEKLNTGKNSAFYRANKAFDDSMVGRFMNQFSWWNNADEALALREKAGKTAAKGAALAKPSVDQARQSQINVPAGGPTSGSVTQSKAIGVDVRSQIKANVEVTAPGSVKLTLPNGAVAGYIPLGAASRGVSAEDAGTTAVQGE